MGNGNPRCAICNGRGGARVNGKWIRCSCTRITPAQRKLQRFMNSAGAKRVPQQGKLFGDE